MTTFQHFTLGTNKRDNKMSGGSTSSKTDGGHKKRKGQSAQWILVGRKGIDDKHVIAESLE